MDIYMTDSACKAVGHNLEIEAGKALCIPKAKRFCITPHMMKKADPWHFVQCLLKLQSIGNQPLYYHKRCNGNHTSLTSSIGIANNKRDNEYQGTRHMGYSNTRS